jgi:hypothetical protein
MLVDDLWTNSASLPERLSAPRSPSRLWLQLGRFNPARVFVLLLSGPEICWLSLSGLRFRDAMGPMGWENRTAHRRSHRL